MFFVLKVCMVGNVLMGYVYILLKDCSCIYMHMTKVNITQCAALL